MSDSNLIHVSETDLSDWYKEAFGIRPRYYKEWWTKDELEAEYNHLSRICEENLKSEKIRQEAAYKRFEKLIEKVIGYGAGNRETAIRWLIEADDFCDIEYKQDVEHFFWSMGLSWEKTEEYMRKY